MRCKINCSPFDTNCVPTYTQAKWKYFYSNCTRLQQNLGLCSASSGAYVPAITVCIQRLF
jgi:hypothetical protein